MKKAIMLVLLLVMAIGMVPMLGHADCAPETPLGSACESGGVVTLDGASSNPDPLDGWLTVDTNTGEICGADQGSPADNNGSCPPSAP